MDKVVKGKFKNSFTDTSGFEEYTKYQLGEAINTDRRFITKEGIYMIGSDEDASVPKGFGGRKFILYGVDGTEQKVEDVWRLEDREDEKVTVLKMENVFDPIEDPFNHMHMDGLGRHEYLTLLLPRDLAIRVREERYTSFEARLRNMSRSKFLDKKVIVSRFLAFSNLTMGIMSRVYSDLARRVDAQTLPVYIIDQDIADDDLNLLQYVYDNGKNYETFSDLIEKCWWQSNMSAFSEVLKDLKEFYRKSYLSKKREAQFLQKVMEVRSTLNK
jgi:hypothetical protein